MEIAKSIFQPLPGSMSMTTCGPQILWCVHQKFPLLMGLSATEAVLVDKNVTAHKRADLRGSAKAARFGCQ